MDTVDGGADGGLASGQEEGALLSCTPACKDRSCGADGCGGSCGSCGAYGVCVAAGYCQCAEGTYTCADGGCISTRALCNGVEDCSTGDDERGCLPDLVLNSFSVGVYGPDEDSLQVCLNRDPDGNPLEDKHQVTVENVGPGVAEAYRIRFGLLEEGATRQYVSADALQLTRGTVHEPRVTMRWTGPFCGAFTAVEPGTYRLWVEVDPDMDIAETTDGNNLLYGSTYTFAAPAAPKEGTPCSALSGSGSFANPLALGTIHDRLLVRDCTPLTAGTGIVSPLFSFSLPREADADAYLGARFALSEATPAAVHPLLSTGSLVIARSGESGYWTGMPPYYTGRYLPIGGLPAGDYLLGFEALETPAMSSSTPPFDILIVLE